MLVPLSWLKEYVDLESDTATLAERLTLAGLEVTAIEAIGDWWDGDFLVTGQVTAVRPHPNADRLVLVDVDHGQVEVQQVVTGAPNLFAFRDMSLEAGDLPTLKVAFAREGATLLNAYSDESPPPRMVLKPIKLRGVRSAGMVCSERELGLSDEHEGILLLPEETAIGIPLGEILADEILDIDLTPDMARCLSMIGVAREVHALTGATLRLPEDRVDAGGDGTIDDFVSVEIEDGRLSPRYTGMVIEEIAVGESPAWMQQRLLRAGMRPINNVVDITNYVMLETGQPLHAFDYDLLLERARRMGSDRSVITVRSARSGEKLTTIDHVERKLDPSMLLITDQAGPIALAGIMGGAETEVHDGSRRILLESATFEGTNNRRTAQTLRLHSEASHRFTRGVPSTLNDIAARRAAELMRIHAEGVIVPGIADAYPRPQPEIRVYTSESDVRRLLGMDLGRAQIAGALEKLDFQVRETESIPENARPEATFGLQRRNEETLVEAVVPWHRLDVAIPADLTEEVARVVGYDQVGVDLIDGAMPPQRRNPVLETEEKIRDILIACGLQDTVNHTLTTPENHRKMSVTSGDVEMPPFIELANPLSSERRVMRRDLMVSALENLAHNLRYSDRLALFEIGRVYRPEDGDDLLPDEDRRIAIALTGSRRPLNYQSSEADREQFDFFDLKGIVETLLNRLGFTPDQFNFLVRPDSTTFGPRCALMQLNGESLGVIGELHPRVRDAFGLPDQRVCLAEMHINPLVQPSWRLSDMGPISSYPPVVEDLAFVVDEETVQRRVRDAIRAAAGELLVDVELFDIYRGESIPVGKKSLAYRLTYQSPERSLEENEIAGLRRRVVKEVEATVGGELRGEST